MEFEELLPMYLDYLKNANKAATTIAQHEEEMEIFFRFLKGKKVVAAEDVKIVHLDMYLSHLVKKGNTSSTRAKKASFLRSFFKYLRTREILPSNPAESLEKIKIKASERKPQDVLTPKETKKFAELIHKNSRLKERNRAIVMIMALCGLRKHEVINLRADDVDFKGKTILVRDGKGGKPRTVLLDEALVKELKEYLKTRKTASDFFFTKRGSDEPMTKDSVQKLMVAHDKKAGLGKKVRAHGLRRVFATSLDASGVSLKHIQIMMGHSDISTTSRYIKPDIEDVMADVQKKSILSKEFRKKEKPKGD